MQKTKEIKTQPKKQAVQAKVERNGKAIEPDLVIPVTLDEDAIEDDNAVEDEEASLVEMDSFDDEDE